MYMIIASAKSEKQEPKIEGQIKSSYSNRSISHYGSCGLTWRDLSAAAVCASFYHPGICVFLSLVQVLSAFVVVAHP